MFRESRKRDFGYERDQVKAKMKKVEWRIFVVSVIVTIIFIPIFIIYWMRLKINNKL